MDQQYLEILDNSELSLLDTIDHVLNRGLVIAGDITISVADIDLIYLGLNVVLGSADIIDRVLRGRESVGVGGVPVNQPTAADLDQDGK